MAARLMNWLAVLMVVGLAVAAVAFAGAGDGGPRGEGPTLEEAVGPTVQLGVRPKARTAMLGAYLNVANCRAALTGANGDHDINAWVALHRQTGWDWSSAIPGYTRFANDKVGIWITAYGTSWHPASTWPNGVHTWGYCMGDNSAIVDKMQTTPAGW